MNDFASRTAIGPRAAFVPLCLLLVLFGFTPPTAATQSDVAKEQRWAEQVVDGLLDGDEVWLDDDDGHEFLGILTEGDAGDGRAVILMHGIGVHPNWPDVIYPLREGLLERGTTSLSIQMPILENDAENAAYAPLFGEVPARIDAAIAYLIDAGYRDVFLVAHSLGASMTAYYLSRGGNDRIRGAVLIGMGRGDAFPGSVDAMAKINLPLLDLYGGDDLEPVRNLAPERAAAGKRGAGDAFQQVRVAGANHFFQGHEDELKRQVIGWLERQDD